MTSQSGNARGSGYHMRCKNTLREKAKEHYTEERKEMEHELESTEQGILKAMNERFEFGQMRREHHRYILEFFNRKTKDKKIFTIAFEENYVKLKDLWENDEA